MAQAGNTPPQRLKFDGPSTVQQDKFARDAQRYIDQQVAAVVAGAGSGSSAPFVLPNPIVSPYNPQTYISFDPDGGVTISTNLRCTVKNTANGKSLTY